MGEEKTKVAKDAEGKDLKIDDSRGVEGKVVDADLRGVDGGAFTPTYDRSKPRKGTHLYDDNE